MYERINAILLKSAQKHICHRAVVLDDNRGKQQLDRIRRGLLKQEFHQWCWSCLHYLCHLSLNKGSINGVGHFYTTFVISPSTKVPSMVLVMFTLPLSSLPQQRFRQWCWSCLHYLCHLYLNKGSINGVDHVYTTFVISPSTKVPSMVLVMFTLPLSSLPQQKFRQWCWYVYTTFVISPSTKVPSMVLVMFTLPLSSLPQQRFRQWCWSCLHYLCHLSLNKGSVNGVGHVYTTFVISTSTKVLSMVLVMFTLPLSSLPQQRFHQWCWSCLHYLCHLYLNKGSINGVGHVYTTFVISTSTKVLSMVLVMFTLPLSSLPQQRFCQWCWSCLHYLCHLYLNKGSVNGVGHVYTTFVISTSTRVPSMVLVMFTLPLSSLPQQKFRQWCWSCLHYLCHLYLNKGSVNGVGHVYTTFVISTSTKVPSMVLVMFTLPLSSLPQQGFHQWCWSCLHYLCHLYLNKGSVNGVGHVYTTFVISTSTKVPSMVLVMFTLPLSSLPQQEFCQWCWSCLHYLCHLYLNKGSVNGVGHVYTTFVISTSTRVPSMVLVMFTLPLSSLPQQGFRQWCWSCLHYLCHLYLNKGSVNGVGHVYTTFVISTSTRVPSMVLVMFTLPLSSLPQQGFRQWCWSCLHYLCHLYLNKGSINGVGHVYTTFVISTSTRVPSMVLVMFTLPLSSLPQQRFRQWCWSCLHYLCHLYLNKGSVNGVGHVYTTFVISPSTKVPSMVLVMFTLPLSYLPQQGFHQWCWSCLHYLCHLYLNKGSVNGVGHVYTTFVISTSTKVPSMVLVMFTLPLSSLPQQGFRQWCWSCLHYLCHLSLNKGSVNGVGHVYTTFVISTSTKVPSMVLVMFTLPLSSLPQQRFRQWCWSCLHYLCHLSLNKGSVNGVGHVYTTFVISPSTKVPSMVLVMFTLPLSSLPQQRFRQWCWSCLHYLCHLSLNKGSVNGVGHVYTTFVISPSTKVPSMVLVMFTLPLSSLPQQRFHQWCWSCLHYLCHLSLNKGSVNGVGHVYTTFVISPSTKVPSMVLVMFTLPLSSLPQQRFRQWCWSCLHYLCHLSLNKGSVNGVGHVYTTFVISPSTKVPSMVLVMFTLPLSSLPQQRFRQWCWSCLHYLCHLSLNKGSVNGVGHVYTTFVISPSTKVPSMVLVMFTLPLSSLPQQRFRQWCWSCLHYLCHLSLNKGSVNGVGHVYTTFVISPSTKVPSMVLVMFTLPLSSLPQQRFHQWCWSCLHYLCHLYLNKGSVNGVGHVYTTFVISPSTKVPSMVLVMFTLPLSYLPQQGFRQWCWSCLHYLCHLSLNKGSVNGVGHVYTTFVISPSTKVPSMVLVMFTLPLSSLPQQRFRQWCWSCFHYLCHLYLNS